MDFTESNAGMDFTGFQEMLKTLTTELPVVDEPETLTYFFGYESSVLNYLPGGELKNHQIWSALEGMTGVHLELVVVDSTTATDKLNLMLASGDYTDLMNMSSYTSGVDAAYEQEIILDLGDKLEENMPTTGPSSTPTRSCWARYRTAVSSWPSTPSRTRSPIPRTWVPLSAWTGWRILIWRFPPPMTS